MHSFYYNDAIIFKDYIINKINLDEKISPKTKSKIATFITETHPCCVPKFSKDISTTCKISLPFYLHDETKPNETSGQLDFAIEYNYTVKSNDSNNTKIEIIIGIYKPHGGNINDNSETKRTQIKNKLQDIIDASNGSTQNIKLMDGLDIYEDAKAKDYKDEFNTACWKYAIKYILPGSLFEQNISTLSTIIDSAIKIFEYLSTGFPKENKDTRPQ